jgi:hypothetical protein
MLLEDISVSYDKNKFWIKGIFFNKSDHFFVNVIFSNRNNIVYKTKIYFDCWMRPAVSLTSSDPLWIELNTFKTEEERTNHDRKIKLGYILDDINPSMNDEYRQIFKFDRQSGKIEKMDKLCFV